VKKKTGRRAKATVKRKRTHPREQKSGVRRQEAFAMSAAFSRSDAVADIPPPFVWDRYFTAATSKNGEKQYSVGPDRHNPDQSGVVVSNGEPVTGIYGLPFPHVNENDENVGARIAWNVRYLKARLGQAKLPLIAYIMGSPDNERAVQDINYYVYYFDGREKPFETVDDDSIWRHLFVTDDFKLYTEWHVRRSNDWFLERDRVGHATSPVPRTVDTGRIAKTAMAPDDMALWSGRNEDFRWTLVGISAIPILYNRTPGHLDDNGTGGRQWFTTPYFDAPTIKGDPWQGVDTGTHSTVDRRVFVIEGVPLVSEPYVYTSHQLYVDAETFFLYRRVLLNSGNPIRTINADFAPAWSADGSRSFELSSLASSINHTKNGETTLVQTKFPCEINTPESALDRLSRGYLNKDEE
jgi:hypothetical protein